MAKSQRPKKGDWIRFQLKADRRVLEGFIQEISPEGTKLKIGKAPDSFENEWHLLSEMTILHLQAR